MTIFAVNDAIRIKGFEVPTTVLEVRPCAEEACDGNDIRFADPLNSVQYWEHSRHFEKV